MDGNIVLCNECDASISLAERGVLLHVRKSRQYGSSAKAFIFLGVSDFFRSEKHPYGQPSIDAHHRI